MTEREAIRYLLWYGQKGMNNPSLMPMEGLDDFVTAYQIVADLAKRVFAIYPKDYQYIEGKPFE